MSDERRLRDEICRVGRSLHARGYVHASAGNISARLADGNGYLITATDACMGTLEPDALVRVAASGAWEGRVRPSKTMALHRLIYEADPAAGCIVHTHSTHLVALTLQGVWSTDDVLPPITPYFVMKVGHVPLIAYRRPGDPAVGEAVAEAIASARARGTTLRAVLVERLGPNVWHRTPAEAGAVLEELEETARLWLMCAPRPAPLGREALAELEREFGAKW